MKFVLALLALAALLINVESQLFHDTSVPDHIAFESFEEYFKRDYHPREKSKRFALFKETRRRVHSKNEKYKLGLLTYKSKINHFADLTREELIARTVGTGEIDYSEPTDVVNSEDLLKHSRRKRQAPDELDYRAYSPSRVSGADDQGNCSCGYAFAATSAIESITAGQCPMGLVKFSAEVLIECSGPFGNKNCSRGSVEFSFEYFKTLSAMPVLNQYPYTSLASGTVKPCRYTPDMISRVKVTDYVKVPAGESNLQTALIDKGPICVYVYVSHDSFWDYAGGVWIEPTCTSKKKIKDHYMLAIGYGRSVSLSQDFWIVKNSWSNTWGIKGYVRVARNKDNMCCIACQCSYPVVQCLP